MTRFQRAAFFGIASFMISFPAVADLPSLMSEHSRGDVDVWNAVDALRRGQLQTAIGTVHYRFSGRGVETQLRLVGAATRAMVGYGGKRRVEFLWHVPVGQVTFTYAAREGDTGYRLEFVRSF